MTTLLWSLQTETQLSPGLAITKAKRGECLLARSKCGLVECGDLHALLASISINNTYACIPSMILLSSRAAHLSLACRAKHRHIAFSSQHPDAQQLFFSPSSPFNFFPLFFFGIVRSHSSWLYI